MLPEQVIDSGPVAEIYSFDSFTRAPRSERKSTATRKYVVLRICPLWSAETNPISKRRLVDKVGSAAFGVDKLNLRKPVSY
jgi:hypothetical protein